MSIIPILKLKNHKLLLQESGINLAGYQEQTISKDNLPKRLILQNNASDINLST
jgi:hypothetical protein